MVKLKSTFKISHFLSGIRSLVLCCVCLLLMMQSTVTQERHQPCTSLRLSCPTYVVSGKAPLTFSADTLGAKQILGEERAKLLSYNWEVSGGKIINGQGTQKIVVEPAYVEGGGILSINVAVEVKGVWPECENKKSCSLKINPTCIAPDKYATYGNLAFNDEKLRLDGFANSVIESGADSIIYILAYAGREACIGEAEWRANRVKNYLIEKYKIESNRIIVVDGGFRDEPAIDLFISSAGGCGPFPSPTLVTSEARIKGPCLNKD